MRKRLYIAKSFYKLFFIALFIVLSFHKSYGTHYRAGEIMYEQVSERLYKITAITYTDPRSFADPSTFQLTIFFGDGSKAEVPRTSRTTLSAGIVQNIYVTMHSYAVDGTYKMFYVDQNRVDDIININLGYTEFIAFYVDAVVVINSFRKGNRSPILTKPPIDNGCLNRKYFHNPAAYDPDGDSMVFELVPPKQLNGEDVPLYEHPKAVNEFSLNSRTGQVYWDAPTLPGIYNIAIRISEYRGRRLIGYVVRDMQIFIDNCVNDPPIVQNIADGCVIVGDSITRIITASDAQSSQRINLYGMGGPFVVDRKATFTPNPAIGQGSVNTRFKWEPSCNQILYNPWIVVFEARDDEVTSPAVGQNSFFVRVIGPSVTNLQTQQINNGFRLTWNKDTCGLAGEYRVFRRVDSSYWNPGECETGIPPSAGFEQIASIVTLNNPDPTFYYDDNNGSGLSPLVNYCYRIVTIFPARNVYGQIITSQPSESVASEEVCDNIIASKPVITKVSVNTTSATLGKIDLEYIRPEWLDTLVYKAPYRLFVKRSVTGQPGAVIVATHDYNKFSDISNVSLVDSLLNTEEHQYTYVVDMHTTMNGTLTFLDSSDPATSVRGIMYSTDRTNIISWVYNVPWLNDSFTVYRKNALNTFDEIARTTAQSYKDTGLTNDQEYCYLVRADGYYRSDTRKVSTVNFSQEICGTPIDTVRPCPPALQVTSPCNILGEYRNRLVWVPQGSCAADVVKHRIYYKQLRTDEYKLIAETGLGENFYIDDREQLKASITGCYYVAGVDSAGNEGFVANEFCIDNCPQYDIPNVFTPNGDGKNDMLLPFPYRFVTGIDMVIMNRWGLEVYSTKNIDIMWDGKDARTSKPCTDGVYFYICDVYETYLEGVKKRTIRGTIQIIR